MAHSDSESDYDPLEPVLEPVKMDKPSQTSTTHWQRNWHKYAAMLVVVALFATGAAIAFGPFAPAVLGFFATVGKVLIGAETIASLSAGLSAAIAWVSVVAASVVTFLSSWGLSKLFGLANPLTKPLNIEEPSKINSNVKKVSEDTLTQPLLPQGVNPQPPTHPRLTDSQSQAKSLYLDDDASDEESDEERDEDLQEKRQEDEPAVEPLHSAEAVEIKEQEPSSTASSPVHTGDYRSDAEAIGREDRRMSVPSASFFVPKRGSTVAHLRQKFEPKEETKQPESPTPSSR